MEYRPSTRRLNVKIMLSYISHFMIFTVFDLWLLTQCINYSFYNLYLLFYYQLQYIYSAFVWRATMHQHIKIQLNRCKRFLRYHDFFSIILITILVTTLNFQKAPNFIRWGVCRADARHHVKYCRNWSIRRRDMAIFRFLTWPPPPS